MKPAVIALLGGFLLSTQTALHAFEIREVVGQLTTQDGQPIAVGESAMVGGVIKSGMDSRAELKVGPSIVRLGANSVLDVQDQQWRLVQGSVLFVLPNGRPGNGKVQIGDAEWTVESGTGFASVSLDEQSRKWGMVGSIGNALSVHTTAGTHYLSSADLVVIPAAAPPRLSQFDLSKQMRTSMLVHGFKSPLSTQDELDREGREFDRLDQRGFIERAMITKGMKIGRTTAVPAESSFSTEQGLSGSVSVVEDAGFSSRLSVFSHLLCKPVEGKKHKLGTIDNCTPPPPPIGDQKHRKFRKFKEKSVKN